MPKGHSSPPSKSPKPQTPIKVVKTINRHNKDGRVIVQETITGRFQKQNKNQQKKKVTSS